MIEAKILADSIAPSGKRLTTMSWTIPRNIQAEVNTHKMLSKNSASSRAIPVEKMIANVINNPFIPMEWGTNQKGMQAGSPLSDEDARRAKDVWLIARDSAVQHAHRLLDLGLHKQIVNRLLEPWFWTTVIISGTTWSNLFGLRDHKDAEPHFQRIARLAHELYDASKPVELAAGEWHMPLVDVDAEDTVALDTYRSPYQEGSRLQDVTGIRRQVSVGRCARVTHLTHEGKRDIAADIELHNRLMNANPGHWSPFEHVARAEADPNLRSGNFQGWTMYRKLFPQEHIGERMP